jgi:hypothetical protein
MRSQIQNASRPPSSWNIPVLNTTGDTIPPHGVMEIVNASEVGEDTIYHVDKPSISGSRVFLINSPAEILPEGAGWGTDSYPTDVAFNAFSGTPSPLEQWDVVVGSFLLAIPIPPILPTGAKYNILGGAHIATVAGDRSLVRAAPATSAGQDTDRLVAADPADLQAKTLIEKLWHAVPPNGFAPVFDPQYHQLVFAENREGVTAGERKVALYTDKAVDGGGPDTDRLVSASPGDPQANAKTLIEKISTAAPPFAFGEIFAPSDHQPVYADLPDGNITQVRFYTRKATVNPPPTPGLGAAWITNNATVPGATSGLNRTPGIFSSYTVVEGNIALGLNIKNYSTMSIPPGTYLGVKEIVPGSWSIWPAVC